MKVDRDKCDSCLSCEKNCPMDIKINDYAASGKRVLSTECILCQKCKDNCPKNAIRISAGVDCGLKERLNSVKSRQK